MKGLSTGLKNYHGRIFQWLKEALSKFANWFSDMLATVKEKLPIVIEKIVSFFQELPGKMLEIGKNIVQGLWNRYSKCHRMVKRQSSRVCTWNFRWYEKCIGNTFSFNFI